jgi:hypothetical protein
MKEICMLDLSLDSEKQVDKMDSFYLQRALLANLNDGCISDDTYPYIFLDGVQIVGDDKLEKLVEYYKKNKEELGKKDDEKLKRENFSDKHEEMAKLDSEAQFEREKRIGNRDYEIDRWNKGGKLGNSFINMKRN